MNQILRIFLILLLPIISYLLGSIPFGLIISKIHQKKDIRLHGSGNIGATNAIRVMGKKLGLLVGFLDMIKASLMIIILSILHYQNIGYTREITTITFGNTNMLFFPIYGVFAVYGHGYSVFINFKGGKCVASGIAFVTALAPLIGVIAVIIFIVALLIGKMVSLASTIGAAFIFLSSIIFYLFFQHGSWIKLAFINNNTMLVNNLLYYLITILSICGLCVLVMAKHHQNFKRIYNKTEPKIKLK